MRRLHPITKLPALPPDAPSIPNSIKKELKNLDPTLELLFSHWALSGLDATPVIHENNPIHWPCWSIWIKDPEGVYWRIAEWATKKGDFIPIDGRLIKYLESDPVRLNGPKEAFMNKKRMEEDNKAKKLKEFADSRIDVAKANKSKIKNILGSFNPNDPSLYEDWETPTLQ